MSLMALFVGWHLYWTGFNTQDTPRSSSEVEMKPNFFLPFCYQRSHLSLESEAGGGLPRRIQWTLPLCILHFEKKQPWRINFIRKVNLMYSQKFIIWPTLDFTVDVTPLGSSNRRRSQDKRAKCIGRALRTAQNTGRWHKWGWGRQGWLHRWPRPKF